MAGARRISLYGILKLLELVFLITTIGIFKGGELVFYGPHSVAIDTFFSGMLVTGIITTTILVFCYFVGQTDNIRQTLLEPLLNLVMFLGLVATGGIAVAYLSSNKNKDLLTHKQVIEAYSMASTSWVASLVYLADFVYSVIKYKK